MTSASKNDWRCHLHLFTMMSSKSHYTSANCSWSKLPTQRFCPVAGTTPSPPLSIGRSTTASVTPFSNPPSRPVSPLHLRSSPSVCRIHHPCPRINATYLHDSNNHPDSRTPCPAYSQPLLSAGVLVFIMARQRPQWLRLSNEKRIRKNGSL